MALSMLSMLLYSLPILLAYILIQHYKPKPNTPPCPPQLPIIGNLHQLGPLIYQSFYHLSNNYDPLFQLHLGQALAVVVSSPAVAEQVLRTHDLACWSRARLVSTQEYSFNGCDIGGTAPYGEHWRNLRKIFILKLLSANKNASFVPIREGETQKMIQSITTLLANPNEDDGQPYGRICDVYGAGCAGV